MITDDEIRALRARGVPISEIQWRYQVSRYRIRAACAGVVAKPKPVVPHKEIIALRKAGLLYKQIAEHLGINFKTVQSYCLRHKIVPQVHDGDDEDAKPVQTPEEYEASIRKVNRNFLRALIREKKRSIREKWGWDTSDLYEEAAQ